MYDAFAYAAYNNANLSLNYDNEKDSIDIVVSKKDGDSVNSNKCTIPLLSLRTTSLYENELLDTVKFMIKELRRKEKEV